MRVRTSENIRLIVAVVVSVEQASQHVAVHAPEGFDIACAFISKRVTTPPSGRTARRARRFRLARKSSQTARSYTGMPAIFREQNRRADQQLTATKKPECIGTERCRRAGCGSV